MAEQAGAPGPTRTEEWRASELFHRPVVHAARVEHLGEVADVVFDPESCELAGLLVGPPGPEGNVLDMVRRAIGRDLGLTFVPADQILALDSDVVMVEARRGRMPLAGGGPRATRWPQLRQVEGHAVLTIQGHRLGRLVDLVLDASGRRVNGYLINPSAPASRPAQSERTFHIAKRAPQSATKTDTRAPESSRPAASNLLVVPASAHVRVGRDLITVGDLAARWDTRQPSAARPSDGRAPKWPAQPNQPSEGPTRSAWRGDADMRYPPDAPTEALS